MTTIFALNSATEEDASLKRMAFLARAPVDDKVDLIFRDNGGETHSVTLTAYEEGRITINKVYPNSVVSNRFLETVYGAESDEPLTAEVEKCAFLSPEIVADEPCEKTDLLPTCVLPGINPLHSIHLAGKETLKHNYFNGI